MIDPGFRRQRAHVGAFGFSCAHLMRMGHPHEHIGNLGCSASGSRELFANMTGLYCCRCLVAAGSDWASTVGLKAGQAAKYCDFLREGGVDISLRILSAAETAASHAQVDNPTVGNKFIFDWLAACLVARMNRRFKTKKMVGLDVRCKPKRGFRKTVLEHRELVG